MYLETYELPFSDEPLDEEATERMLQELDQMVEDTDKYFDSWLESLREMRL